MIASPATSLGHFQWITWDTLADYCFLELHKDLHPGIQQQYNYRTTLGHHCE